MRYISILLFVIFISCGGSSGNDVDPSTGKIIWNEENTWYALMDCIETNLPDEFQMDYEQPEMQIVPLPCGRKPPKHLAGCNPFPGVIEVHEDYIYDVDGNFNTELYLHECMHDLNRQIHGSPDIGHNSVWYTDPDFPCRQDFLGDMGVK